MCRSSKVRFADNSPTRLSRYPIWGTGRTLASRIFDIEIRPAATVPGSVRTEVRVRVCIQTIAVHNRMRVIIDGPADGTWAGPDPNIDNTDETSGDDNSDVG